MERGGGLVGGCGPGKDRFEDGDGGQDARGCVPAHSRGRLCSARGSPRRRGRAGGGWTGRTARGWLRTAFPRFRSAIRARRSLSPPVLTTASASLLHPTYLSVTSFFPTPLRGGRFFWFFRGYSPAPCGQVADENPRLPSVSPPGWVRRGTLMELLSFSRPGWLRHGYVPATPMAMHLRTATRRGCQCCISGHFLLHCRHDTALWHGHSLCKSRLAPAVLKSVLPIPCSPQHYLKPRNPGPTASCPRRRRTRWISRTNS